MTFPTMTVLSTLCLISPALYALLGVLLGAVIGPLVVFVIALCAGDGEELVKVLPGRFGK